MRLFCTLCATALLLALFPLPIEYYTFLRIFISLGALAVLIQEIKRDVSLTGILFIMVLFVFNPIVPVYLYKKSLWMAIDLAVAVLFLVYAYQNQPNK